MIEEVIVGKRTKERTVNKQIYAFTLDPDIILSIDRIRGNISRSTFINQILRRWLIENDRGYQ